MNLLVKRKLFLVFVAVLLGLACNFPLALSEVTHTPPSLSTPSSPPAPVETPTIEHTYTLSKREQTEIFLELWGTVDEEYLYEDFNGVNWEAVLEQYGAKIEEGLSDQDFYQAMYDMVAELGDEHSVFLTPEEVIEEDAAYDGSFDYVGVGIFVGAVPERDRAVIYLVFPDSPADRAGIRAHDSILQVDGQPVLDEEGYMTDGILGEEGAPVMLLVQYPGEEPRELVVNRARIIGSIPVPYQAYTTPAGKRIGYIMLPTFSDSSVGDQVEDALRDLSADGPLDGLILDNRANAGGFDTVMNHTMRYFMGGKVGYFVNRQFQDPFEVEEQDINGSLDFPIVVLVGKGTISFGEVFSGLMQDAGRAYLIGETTDGNVEILWGYDFDDGSRAWIAHDTFVPANNLDVDWEKTGIVPDLEVLTSWDLITPDADPAIQAALEYFDQGK